MGPPSTGLPDLDSLTNNGGVNPQKGTHRREVLPTRPIPGICGPD
jgi:hypothetical protein